MYFTPPPACSHLPSHAHLPHFCPSQSVCVHALVVCVYRALQQRARRAYVRQGGVLPASRAAPQRAEQPLWPDQAEEQAEEQAKPHQALPHQKDQAEPLQALPHQDGVPDDECTHIQQQQGPSLTRAELAERAREQPMGEGEGNRFSGCVGSIP